MNNKKLAQELIDFIDKSTSPFHVIHNMKKELDKKGFVELELQEEWKLEKQGAYYVTQNGSTILAFTVGAKDIEESGFRIIGTHTDSPGFKVKSNPEITTENKYVKLNTEVYGGPLLRTWFDRPLSIAGRVVAKSDNVLEPEEILFDLKKAMLIIPSLAIHLNKKQSEEIDPQKVCLPVMCLSDEENNRDMLLNAICNEVGIETDNVLDFESYLYPYEKGCIMGLNDEFISCSRLDNLASTKGALESLIQSLEFDTDATNIIVGFDNEEIGSQSKQGAGSNLLAIVLERIAISLGKTKEQLYRSYAKSFFISADLAHPIHPNYAEVHDNTNRPIMNKGVVIKTSALGKYTSDSVSTAIFEDICKSAGVPTQKFYNLSGERTGSTIGPMISTHLPIRIMDMGVPVLAMHSARELAGLEDYAYEISAFTRFFTI